MIRNENLQILRFIAAAMVLVTHVSFYIIERTDVLGKVFIDGADAGVSIFFIISGFVMHVSGAKLERNLNGAWIFIRRRIARIFPMYWLLTTFKLLIAVLVPTAILHNYPDFLFTLSSYALIPVLDAAGKLRSPLYSVGWTLLHEMFFYYIFALSLMLRRQPLVYCSFGIIALWLSGLVMPITSALGLLCTSELNLFFVVGMALASLHQTGFRLSRWFSFLVLLAALSMITNSEFRGIQSLYLGRFNIGATLLVLALLSIEIPFFPRFKELLIGLGGSSYSLYLIHPILAPFICLLLVKLSFDSFYFVLLTTTALCVIFCHFIYRFIEIKVNSRITLLMRTIFKDNI
jgi:exopolysaccharide production protein ExoZ